MTPHEFETFRHDAVHALMGLNDSCEREFQLSTWPHWHYDLDNATLTFLKNNAARVIASIQLVGTTSERSGTWLWGWANEHIQIQSTQAMSKVRAFGERESLSDLTTPSLADEEYLGWEMTSIAAKVLGSKGAYRCPGENGFLYFVYTDLSFAVAAPAQIEGRQVKCGKHNVGYETFVCEHLISRPAQRWFSDEPTEENKWPDSCCSECEAIYLEQGESNDTNKTSRRIRLLCHHCYGALRSKSKM